MAADSGKSRLPEALDRAVQSRLARDFKQSSLAPLERCIRRIFARRKRGRLIYCLAVQAEFWQGKKSEYPSHRKALAAFTVARLGGKVYSKAQIMPLDQRQDSAKQ